MRSICVQVNWYRVSLLRKVEEMNHQRRKFRLSLSLCSLVFLCMLLDPADVLVIPLFSCSSSFLFAATCDLIQFFSLHSFSSSCVSSSLSLKAD